MAPTTCITCPYCQRAAVRAHPVRCPDNPDMRTRLAAALADPDRPGYAISRNLYTLHACTLGLPAEATIKRHYGSWGAALLAFGLQATSAGRKAKPRKPQTRTRRNDVFSLCPHCNTPFRDSNVVRHVRCCLYRPGLRERLRELIEDTPGCGIGLTDYRRRLATWRAEQPTGADSLPSAPTIKTYFPEWDGFLHWLGLLSEDEIIEAKAAADNARYRAAWREHHAHELDAWGLPVASVQKPVPIVRVLPSGGTATMIR